MGYKVLNHPLIAHKLTIMRRKDTSTKDFRQNLDEIAGLMAYEITRDVETKEVEVETPLVKTTQKKLAEDIILVPILRAGLGMVDGIRSLIPTAKIGHIGVYRDEETFEAKEYFNKLPESIEDAYVMVLDPMLATGVSASAALTMIKQAGAKKIKLVCLVGVMEGINAVSKEHPDVEIVLAALDEGLNEKNYIMPGLGDAGDRLFGTK
ncbi:uracil phosphoribosyltransferase [Bacilli bacterium PM5-3]|nr:uracil phosphoribosyltransferase [Bacilli bacterium PM5-3]MDH6603694.1 uracil phosphoribosyltransferase [Bacilli bacterium PM5-9]